MREEDHRHWEMRYAGDAYFYGTRANDFLIDCRSLLPKTGSALAPADGEGRNSVFLAEQGLAVTSLDFSETAQAKARALAEARGVAIDTVNADLMNWEWPEAAYDVVVAVFVQFLGPAQREILFGHLRRTLKSGGLLILEGFRTDQINLTSGGPRQSENLYSRVLLEDAFGDFTDLAITERDAHLGEGEGHVGPAALIDLVGRKP